MRWRGWRLGRAGKKPLHRGEQGGRVVPGADGQPGQHLAQRVAHAPGLVVHDLGIQIEGAAAAEEGHARIAGQQGLELAPGPRPEHDVAQAVEPGARRAGLPRGQGLGLDHERAARAAEQPVRFGQRDEEPRLVRAAEPGGGGEAHQPVALQDGLADGDLHAGRALVGGVGRAAHLLLADDVPAAEDAGLLAAVDEGGDGGEAVFGAGQRVEQCRELDEGHGLVEHLAGLDAGPGARREIAGVGGDLGQQGQEQRHEGLGQIDGRVVAAIDPGRRHDEAEVVQADERLLDARQRGVGEHLLDVAGHGVMVGPVEHEREGEDGPGGLIEGADDAGVGLGVEQIVDERGHEGVALAAAHVQAAGGGHAAQLGQLFLGE